MVPKKKRIILPTKGNVNLPHALGLDLNLLKAEDFQYPRCVIR